MAKKQKKAEEEPEDRNPPEIGLSVVSGEEFAVVELEAPIAQSSKVDCTALGELYFQAAKKAEEDGDENARKVFGLLQSVTQMHFKPGDRAEPYGPVFVIDGKRSLIPDDLSGEQSAIFAELAPRVKNPALRARLADIAWQNDKSLGGTAQLAISSFSESVARVADGSGQMYLDDEKASGHNVVELLRRACQIATMTGWKDPESKELKDLIGAITQTTFDEKDGGKYINIAELNIDFGITDPNDLINRAGTISEDADPDTARHLWELEARAYRYCSKKNEADHNAEMEAHSNRCLTEAAECYVRMAEAAGFEGMIAASWLMDAIKALRNIPGTGERRKELETRLRKAQSSISDEMGRISTGFDLSDIVDQARKSVAGLTLAQSLAQFASLDRSPSEESLRKDVLEQAEKHPLSSIIPMSIHDDEGKIVAKSQGLTPAGEPEDEAIKHLIARHESLRRQVTVSGMIEPARRLINSEHPLQARHFEPLAGMSPFVPAGHEDLFALGFARFFCSDYISATHILVPQLENSLRYVLKQAAIDPSLIHNDMTQENRGLSVLLEKDRQTLEKIFGPEIVFEIEMLFDFRGGPHIRHDFAHGLASAGTCYGSDAIYACWFIFRLCCLPLFPHWQEVTDRYTDM